jgi:hypothetical protein
MNKSKSKMLKAYNEGERVLARGEACSRLKKKQERRQTNPTHAEVLKLMNVKGLKVRNVTLKRKGVMITASKFHTIGTLLLEMERNGIQGGLFYMDQYSLVLTREVQFAFYPDLKGL